MTPFEVPITIAVVTAKHDGCPKFLLPTSENAWPVIFRSFVQRTASQGPWGSASMSGVPGDSRLVRDDFREWMWDRNGEDGRKPPTDEVDNRDWKRRSKGLCDGLGLGRGELRNANALLLNEEGSEP